MSRWAVRVAGFLLLVALSVGGDLATQALHLAIPGPVLGMAAYLVILALVPGAVELTAPAARLILRLLGALIVPAAVGLAAFAPYVASAAAPLLAVLVLSTLITGVTTALVYAGLKR